jgi:alpha-D-ribose 1-methylphosphonate 5-triphosphate synthase subunit PhnH
VISVLALAFAEPVLDAQSVFRTVMDAMARPGEVRNLSCDLVPPAPLSAGAAAVALTLFDYETLVWLDGALADSDDVARWLRFHTGAPIIDDMRQAAFAMIAAAGNMPDFSSFAPGTPDYPDRSATLILQLQSLSAGQTLTLTGPGIDGEQKLSAQPLPADFADRMIANRTLFPRGVDLLLVAENAIAAIPRSTHVVRGD